MKSGRLLCSLAALGSLFAASVPACSSGDRDFTQADAGGEGGDGAGGDEGAGGSASCNECPEGSSTCSGDELRLCQADARGCLRWSDPETCASGACVSSTACVACGEECSMGEAICEGSSLVHCAANSDGCLEFAGTPQVCEGDTPVCNAAEARCECEEGATRCDDGSTVAVCTSAMWASTACPAETPTCIAGSGCQPCTEHSQCPASACHLAGPKQGSCFDPSTVVDVSTVEELYAGYAALTNGTERVFRLAAGTYSLTADPGALTIYALSGTELALIGTDGVIIEVWTYMSDPRFSAIDTGTDGFLYLSRITMNGNPSMSGVLVSSSNIAWLDDVRIHGFWRPFAVGYAELHVRRSWLQSAGIPAEVRFGSLFMENSAFGPSETSDQMAVDALSVWDGATIGLRNVTIAGNKSAISCPTAVPPVGGVVRNSILTSIAGNSVTDGDGHENCDAIQFFNNAMDQDDLGELIPWTSGTWFVDADNGDFHLTQSGKDAIPTTASIGADDPTVDVDGDLRPATDGYPGLDEP